MQDLSLFDGVDIEAAEAVCARGPTGLFLLPGGDVFDHIKTTECNTAASSKPNLSDQQTRLLSARPVLSLPSTYFMFLQFASEKLLNVNLFFRGSLSCFYQKNYITENPSFILSW